MARPLAVLLLAGCGGKEPPPQAAPVQATREPVAATAAAESEAWTEPTSAPKRDEIAVGITDITGGVTSVELVCTAGHRDRQAVIPDAARIGGTVWFRGVATDSCTLWFKGGQPAQYGPVKGGTAWLCTLVGTTAVCERK